MTAAGHSMRIRQRWFGICVMLLITVLTVSACWGLPRSGPVMQGETVDAADGESVFAPVSPVEGDTPDGIVTGFIAASAMGVQDNFEVAREFLTPQIARTWVPTSKVIVYARTPGITITRNYGGTVELTVPLLATIDETGRYVEAEPDATAELTFGVEEVDGESRISQLDNGIVLTSVEMQSALRSAPVYFLNPDMTYLVPDRRWFPATAARTSLVATLLEGPPDVFADAVTTAVPTGTRLSVESVTETDGVASVDLTSDALKASARERALMQLQITESLTQLPTLTNVEVTVQGAPFMASGSDVSHVRRDPSVGSGPFIIAKDRIAKLDERAIHVLNDVHTLAGYEPTAWAANGDGSVFAIRHGTGTILTVAEDGQPPKVVLLGPDLTPPSFDRFGWLWSTPRRSPDGITVRQGNATVHVVAGGFADREVLDIQVSREGTRAAVISRDSTGTSSIDLVGIVRSRDGTPRELTASTRFGRGVTDPSQLAWVDELSVVVLGSSDLTDAATPFVARVGDSTRTLSTLEGLDWVASGKGEQRIFSSAANEEVFARAANGWQRVAMGVVMPIFPG